MRNNIERELVVPRPKDRRREAVTDKILAAARAQVVKGGFASLSIHKVAKATDYTPGALYRYYPSKDALVAALTIEIINEFAENIAELIETTPGTVEEKIRAALHGYVELARVAPEEFGVLSMLLADSQQLIADDLAGPAIDALVDALRPLQQLFLEAFPVHATEVPANAAGEPSATARLALERATIAFAAVHGVLQLRKQIGRTAALGDLESLVSLAINSLLTGFSNV